MSDFLNNEEHLNQKQNNTTAQNPKKKNSQNDKSTEHSLKIAAKVLNNAFLNKAKTKFAVSMVSFGVLSASLLTMRITTNLKENGQPFWMIVNGIVFWISLIIGFGMLISLNNSRKKAGYYPKSPIGLLSFFSNGTALWYDICFIASALALAYIILRRYFHLFGMLDAKAVTYELWIVAVFTFCLSLHSMINGRNYNFINQIKKQLRSDSKYEKQ